MVININVLGLFKIHGVRKPRKSNFLESWRHQLESTRLFELRRWHPWQGGSLWLTAVTHADSYCQPGHSVAPNTPITLIRIPQNTVGVTRAMVKPWKELGGSLVCCCWWAVALGRMCVAVQQGSWWLAHFLNSTGLSVVLGISDMYTSRGWSVTAGGRCQHWCSTKNHGILLWNRLVYTLSIVFVSKQWLWLWWCTLAVYERKQMGQMVVW